MDKDTILVSLEPSERKEWLEIVNRTKGIEELIEDLILKKMESFSERSGWWVKMSEKYGLDPNKEMYIDPRDWTIRGSEVDDMEEI